MTSSSSRARRSVRIRPRPGRLRPAQFTPAQSKPALSSTVPVAASAITTNRLTANPCAAVKDAKLLTHPANKDGCGVPDMSLTMPVRVP